MASTHTSMRHAILITAYTDFVQLISLVEMFDYRFDIYIHIDKKAKISNTCFHLLEALPNVKVVDRVYAVNWGGRNHIDAILWLCREAIKNHKMFLIFIRKYSQNFVMELHPQPVCCNVSLKYFCELSNQVFYCSA